MATEIHAVLRDPTDGGDTDGIVHQSRDFLSGNEAAARAARDIGFHVMGYFPITPSTEVAETLSKMQASGEHDIVMIPADGEHGAAGGHEPVLLDERCHPADHGVEYTPFARRGLTAAPAHVR